MIDFPQWVFTNVKLYQLGAGDKSNQYATTGTRYRLQQLIGAIRIFKSHFSLRRTTAE